MLDCALAGENKLQLWLLDRRVGAPAKDSTLLLLRFVEVSNRRVVLHSHKLIVHILLHRPLAWKFDHCGGRLALAVRSSCEVPDFECSELVQLTPAVVRFLQVFCHLVQLNVLWRWHVGALELVTGHLLHVQ